MVKRFTPCHKYFDQWDEDGSPSCEEAKDGEYVLYDTYRNEHVRLTAQIQRLQKQVSILNQKLKEKSVEETEEQTPSCYE